MQTSLMFEIGGLILMSAATLRAAASVTALAGRRRKLSQINREYLQEFDRLAEKSLEAHRAERLRLDSSWEGTRKFRVARRIYEDPARSVCSFYLQPYDDRPLPRFEPGQFLTFRLGIPGQEQAVMRCYSLSESPSEEGYYRVTIKRLARRGAPHRGALPSASNFFHDALQEGAIVEAFAPSGEFTLDPESDRPLVFVAGGVGLTPFMSMLNWLIANGSSREVWLFYGVRNRSEHLMQAHLQAARRVHPRFRTVTAYSRPTPRCRQGHDYDVAGHIGVHLMAPLLRARACDIYVCGPDGMMNQVTRDLVRFGVPQSHIKLERFIDESAAPPPAEARPVTAPNSRPVTVAFARSAKQAPWTGNAGSLLEFAESGGIKARCGCRQGICGLCTTRLREGEVEIFPPPGQGAGTRHMSALRHAAEEQCSFGAVAPTGEARQGFPLFWCTVPQNLQSHSDHIPDLVPKPRIQGKSARSCLVALGPGSSPGHCFSN